MPQRHHNIPKLRNRFRPLKRYFKASDRRAIHDQISLPCQHSRHALIESTMKEQTDNPTNSQSHTLQGGERSVLQLSRLAPRERPKVPTDHEAGWVSESVWTLRRRISSPLPEVEPLFLGLPAGSIISIPSAISVQRQWTGVTLMILGRVKQFLRRGV